MIYLSYYDLALTSILLLLTGILSIMMRLGAEKNLAVASFRMITQLLILGLILKTVFSYVNIYIFMAMITVMIISAGIEINSRQTFKFRGMLTFYISTSTMGSTALILTFFTLFYVIGKKPWYTPQYAIPLAGMMLGNTMNGISIGMDRLSHSIVTQKNKIETRLMLGHTPEEAIKEIKRESIKSGMIPIINSMSVAGLVTLPGMMTGQILAGSPPVEAVKYQILIMILIASCSSFGTMISVHLSSKNFFDSRERLRLERLK